MSNKTNNNYNEKSVREMKPIRFFYENGTTVFIQSEYPEELTLGDVWLDPKEDEWAGVTFEFYNSIESYDNRMY